MIVYARPSICEKDESGHVVAEVYKPDIKNTRTSIPSYRVLLAYKIGIHIQLLTTYNLVCVFTKNIAGTTDGHNKINELLDNGLYGVGMLYFKSRNMTLWIQPHISDDGTIDAKAFIKQTPKGSLSGDLDTRLYHGPNPKYPSKLSFGAKVMQDVEINDNGDYYNHGFEWVKLQFPSWDDEAGKSAYFMVIAVKIPEEKDVASRFILYQKIRPPGNKNWMYYMLAKQVEVKKKKPVIVIAPRPLGISKIGSSSATTNRYHVARKGLLPNSRGLVGKPTFKRWARQPVEKEGRMSSRVKELEDVDIKDADADNDCSTLKDI